jgi:hypothetical protein
MRDSVNPDVTGIPPSASIKTLTTSLPHIPKTRRFITNRPDQLAIAEQNTIRELLINGTFSLMERQAPRRHEGNIRSLQSRLPQF